MMRATRIGVLGLLALGALSPGVLAQPACDEAGTVKSELRIGQFGSSGFTGQIDPADRFGESVANIGDLDGDGISDLAVGADFDDDGGTDRGALWILFMNSDGTVRDHQKISSNEGGFLGPLDNVDLFGVAVAGLGDLDGDGVVDVIVGAEGDDDAGTDRGAAWVLFLNDNGTVKRHQKISSMEGGFSGSLLDMDRFGDAIANLGDVDADGVIDLAVGAYQTNDGGDNRGAVWILFLSTDGTVKGHQKIAQNQGGFGGGLNDNDEFGVSVATLDGGTSIALAVGSWRDDSGGNNRGSVWILFLNPDGTVQSYQKISHLDGGFSGDLGDLDFFGSSVARLGDLDGDGVQDLGVGAIRDDDGGTNRGALWILFMNPDGTVKGEQKISQTEGGFGDFLRNNTNFGRSVTSLGDLNADGRPEIAVGAYSIDDPAYASDVWLLSVNTCEPPIEPCLADLDGDRDTDADDFFIYLDLFSQGCD